MNDLSPTTDSHANPPMELHTHNQYPIFYANPRSIVNKLEEFQSLVYSKSYDIISLTETWLSDTIYDSEFLPYNYNIFRKDRPSHGGGVLIAFEKNIPCQIIDSPEGLETICIKLTLSSPITVCIL